MSWYIHVYSPTIRQSSRFECSAVSKSKNILNHTNLSNGNILLGGSSQYISGLVHPSYKWINPTKIPCKSLGLQPIKNEPWSSSPPSWDVKNLAGGNADFFHLDQSKPTPQSVVNIPQINGPKKKGPIFCANDLRLNSEVSILCATKSQGKGWKLSDLLLYTVYCIFKQVSLRSKDFKNFKPLIFRHPLSCPNPKATAVRSWASPPGRVEYGA